MPTEFQRKFLITSNLWKVDVEKSEEIQQANMIGDGFVLRVRVKSGLASLVLKEALAAGARIAHRTSIDLGSARRIIQDFGLNVVEKTRHFVRHGDRQWRVDEYPDALGMPLVAEVETPSAETPLDLPSWTGAEVTGQRQYYFDEIARRR